ncbi:MAG: cyclic nucleotide-binding domain-containing protein [Deltaproteobacteria bacterium]|nr:cyclic nucleotide-binding domain-containing protein [Deltaproteobacteria bacterium]
MDEIGVEGEKALILLALHRSSAKYGYELSHKSLSHLFMLAKKEGNESPLHRLCRSPFFLMKACWLYEHAPYFLFFDGERHEELNEYIIQFASKYESQFLNLRFPTDNWTALKGPRRVKAVTFWENQILDPVSMLERALHDNIEGLELSFDFHPFNYTRLLPEELSSEKRVEIKEACIKSGIRIDIHSPIVGPYAPSPDPKKGKQLFFDPLKCFELLCETIELAKDIGAGSVVVHLIDNSDPEKLADLVRQAEGSAVRVTIENYCQTQKRQDSSFFIASIDKIYSLLPDEVRKNNFGITIDVGHFNIEGEDPLVAVEMIGRYCLTNGIYLRVHATDNYGKLLFSPPSYSADVHGNVSGRGINISAVIKLLRSMGHRFDVVAEQIRPLTPEDIETIHQAQTSHIGDSFEAIVSKGIEALSTIGLEALITPDITKEKAYQFLAGLEGVPALREHLIYRKIQDKKYLSVDEVKKISLEFMKMPSQYKEGLMEYIDDLLLPIQTESGSIQKNELDLICQNICGALFGSINNDHLELIFEQQRICDRDEIICEQGSIGSEMYLIKEGEVKVYINGSPMAVLGPGEIFGEISLFYNVKRTATIKAGKDKTTLGILTRNGLEILLKSNQPHSYDLIYRLYAILPDRLRNLNDKYKTAIEALRLILDGDGSGSIPMLDNLSGEATPRMDLFPSFAQEEAKKIFTDTLAFDADQLVFAEGDKGDGAYYILEGKVKAVTFSSDYEEIVLGELEKGEIFGEMALIDDKPRSTSILTVTPCRLAFIRKDAFTEFIELRTDLSFRMMGYICLTLFWRILRLDKVYADIKKSFK